MSPPDADAMCARYFDNVSAVMKSILTEEADATDIAADRLADQIAADRLVHIYGPGGHSNLASQEVFFRAGGLMHISAILDEGTLLSNGALRSTAMERTPGYGKLVIAQSGLGPGDLLILVNAFGINSALIDAANEAQTRGVFTISVSSKAHATKTPADHPARHPSKENLHDIADLALDSKVPFGDTLLDFQETGHKVGPCSTIANAFLLNCLILRTMAKLVERGIEPPIWSSNNAPGGDEANARFIAQFKDRIRWL